MILAFLIGIPTLKLVGDYYAIVSLGLGEAIRLIIENWNDVTRRRAAIRESTDSPRCPSR